jgi:organic hydroperoxide reductase OsmC/OhrA
MADHHASLRWTRTSSDFAYNSYNRAHEISFKDGKVVVPFSAAVAFKGDADRVDPEDAFVGSLSSCHMLTFLFICAQKKLVVDSYEDDAVGRLEKGANGKLWMAQVTLKPRVKFAPGVTVDKPTLDEIHHRAHEDCFIALSVKTEVSVEPHY